MEDYTPTALKTTLVVSVALNLVLIVYLWMVAVSLPPIKAALLACGQLVEMMQSEEE